jgi:superfamily II DNA or RNA helicase
MAAEFVGAEVKTTKRFRLGELLAGATRHLLLLSATPHNGKEPDFQLFMGLLDGDRFPGGRPTAEARPTYTADLMRRMVKEDLVRFDGTPLFPERIATTLSYRLSPAEAELYDAVTSYVRHEFDRAEELETGRKSRIGFALTVLQRRLASSPQAIHQSLKRRRERLEQRRRELPASPAEQPLPTASEDLPEYTADDWDDLAEAQAADVEEQEAQFVDQATAATTVAELQEELRTLEALEARALKVLQSGADRKWEELRRLLADDASMRDAHGRRRKLVVFTEHRDTLLYLADRIRAFLGRPEAVACIHGGLSRTARLAAQAAFTQDRHVEVLVATDAAGEGINLQRAHLMVNYDLPWNPNRLEQRFGRIHRIGQTEVCHLWNLVADQTREGDVFHRLLSKIEQQCAALQGKVFDILGRLLNEAELHQMMIEAVRYGDSPETREKLRLQIDHAVDPERLRALFEDRALARNALDTSKLHAIREHMERANARRLQPHYIAGFFIAALRALGGTIEEREPGRYEIHQVPLHVRHRSLSASAGGVALPRYERVTFDTDVRSADAEVAVDLLGPGHPLLAAVVDATLERHRALLRRGAVLVDSTNRTAEPRALVYLDHAIRDGRTDRTGQRCVVSQRMYFVELSADGAGAEAGPAPYLDYRPLAAGELAAAHDIVAACAAWRIEDRATRFAAAHLVPQHLEDVRREKVEYVRKVAQAVEDRLTKEIRYWQQRAEQLLHEEQAGGKPKMSSRRARELAAEMEARLQRRLDELRREAQVAPAPPNVVGAALVIPVALLDRAQAQPERSLGRPALAEARAAVEHRAMAAVMAHERALGCEPVDVSAENRGYDIESRDHSRGRLRFIEVKGRAAGAGTVTVSRNEVLTALNKPDAYILAIVEIDGDRETVHYHQRPFQGDHGFAVTHVTYDFGKLLAGKGARA